jgi:hypothetical protein
MCTRYAAYLHLSVGLVFLGRIPKSHIERREIHDIVPNTRCETLETVVLSAMLALDNRNWLRLTPQTHQLAEPGHLHRPPRA